MAADAAPPLPTTPARPSGLGAALLVGLALVAAYAPNFIDLVRKWWDDPNYSHGFLVIPIALAILWQRRPDLAAIDARPSLLGWAVVLAVLAARVWLFERNEQWVEAATLPLTAAGLFLAFGGWPLLRWALPGVVFLWLMLPLPPRINMILAGPLQRLATLGSTAVLQLIGLSVMAQGNVIYVGTEQLNVEQACNGLSMLLSFVTLLTATVIMLRTRPIWERAVLLLSTVPIALVSNILRIVLIALCYRWLGREWGHKIGHDWGGFLMMPIALLLVLAELKLLGWLIVEEEMAQGPLRPVNPVYMPPGMMPGMMPAAGSVKPTRLKPQGPPPGGPDAAGD